MRSEEMVYMNAIERKNVERKNIDSALAHSIHVQVKDMGAAADYSQCW